MKKLLWALLFVPFLAFADNRLYENSAGRMYLFETKCQSQRIIHLYRDDEPDLKDGLLIMHQDLSNDKYYDGCWYLVDTPYGPSVWFTDEDGHSWIPPIPLSMFKTIKPDENSP